MGHLTRAFDAHVRVLECRNCGAPVTMERTEREFECAYCRAVNLFSPPALAASKPPEEPRALFDPRALAALESRLGDPDHLAWVHAEARRSAGPLLLDVAGSPPPDLQAMTEIISWNAWVSERLPALRAHWQEAVSGDGAPPRDPRAQHRVYWLAMRLSDGHSIAARAATTDEDREAHMLRRRAVLETALQHVEATPYSSALRCRLSRAACHAGDLESARAWLASCSPNPESVEIDAELRVALATLKASLCEPRAILQVLEPGGTPIPFRVAELEVPAIVYRVHAHEVLGDRARSLEALRAGCLRYGKGRLRGQLGVEQVAPMARARLWLPIWLGALVILGSLVTLVVVLVRVLTG